MISPVAPSIIVLLLLLSVQRLIAQTPDIITLTKKFSYQQTDGATLDDYQPAISIFVKFTGGLSAATRVTLTTNASTTFTLTRSTGDSPGTSSFSATQVFSNQNALNAALPTASYTLTVTGNALSTPFVFSAAFDSTVSAPLFTNFNALQSWNGETLQFFWQPIPSATSSDTTTFVLQRSLSPTESYTFSNGSGSSSLPPGATGTGYVGINSPVYEVLYGTLAYTRLRSPAAIVGSAQISFFQTVEVRVPVQQPPALPVITSHPQSQTVIEGRSVTLSSSNYGAQLSFVWRKDGVVVTENTSGVRISGGTLIILRVQRSDAGTYSLTISNRSGSVTTIPATLTVTPSERPPFISAWPLTPSSVAIGQNYSVSLQAFSLTPVVVRWYRDGVPLRATSASNAVDNLFSAALTFSPFLAADVGSYYVTVTNSAGTDTSPTFVLAPIPPSRITNLSVLTSLATPGDTFTLGYVLGGAYTSGQKNLVLRAAGPALAALGVGTPLVDPLIELFAGSSKTAENDNWGGAPPLSAAFASVGAFPYQNPLSKDAAVSTSIATRENSVKISSADRGTGTVIAEIYDATLLANVTSTTPRLLNVSVLKSLGTGLTVGFTITGSAPKTVLVRAIGPTLGAPPFNVAGSVADPLLTLFNSSSAKIAENDNWSGTASLTAAFASVGAFALPASSKDAALVTTLAAGGYSVQIIGVGDPAGVALVEVYELP